MSDFRPNEDSSVATETVASVTPAAVGTLELGATLPDSSKSPSSSGKLPFREIEFRVRGKGFPTRRLRLSGSRYTIGNGVGCSIRLDDPTLRPLHAVLIRDSRRILLRAYSVPVVINGSRSMEGTLEPGDEIQFGVYHFELLARSPDASDGVSQSLTLSSVADGPSAPDAWQENMRLEAKRWRQRRQELQRQDAEIRDREQDLEDRAKWLQEQQTRLQQREDELASQEHAAVEVQAEFQRRYEELERARLELAEERTDLEAYRADLKHRNDVHAGRDKQSEERIAQLIAQQREFDALQLRQREEMQSTGEQLLRARREAEEATAAVRRMHEQMSNLNAQLDQLGGEQTDLREKHRVQLKGFRLQSEELTNQLADADENRRKALEELAETRVAHQEALQTIDRVSAQLGDAIQSKSQVQSDLDRSHTDLEELQSRYETLKSSHDSLHDTHETLHATHDELAQNHRVLRVEHADACSKRDDLLAQVEQLEADLQAAKTEAESLQRDCQLARESVEELRSLNRETLDHQDTERQRWESELSQLRDQVDELSQQLNDAEGKLIELRNENGRLSQQLAASETERDILSEDVVALKQTNEETVQERDSFRSQVYATESELELVRQERDQAKDAAASARELWDHSNRDHDDTLDRIERIEKQTREVIAGETTGGVAPTDHADEAASLDFKLLTELPEAEQRIDPEPESPESGPGMAEPDSVGSDAIASEPESLTDAVSGSDAEEPVVQTSADTPTGNEPLSEMPGIAPSPLRQDSDAWPTYDTRESILDQEPEPSGWAASDTPVADPQDGPWPQSMSDTGDPVENAPAEMPKWETADVQEAEERLGWNTGEAAETTWHAPEIQTADESDPQASVTENQDDEPEWLQQTQATGWNTIAADTDPMQATPSGADPYATVTDAMVGSDLTENEQVTSTPVGGGVNDPLGAGGVADSLAETTADVDSEVSELSYQPIDPWAEQRETTSVPSDEVSLERTGSLADQLLREISQDEQGGEPSTSSHSYPSTGGHEQTSSLPEIEDGVGAEVAEMPLQETAAVELDPNQAQHTSQWNASLETEAHDSASAVEGTLQMPEDGFASEPNMSVTQPGFEGPGPISPLFDSTEGQASSVSAFAETQVAPEPESTHSGGDVEVTHSDASPVTEVDSSGHGTGSSEAPEDDSIEAYMNRLLQRVGGSSDEATAATTTSSVTATVAAESAAISESSVVPEPEPAPEPEVGAEPIDPDAPLVPRSQAPERNRDLSAMRELANQSARSAISKSAKFQSKHTRSQAMVKFASAGIAIACGLAAFALVQGFLKAIAAVAALIIAGVYVKEGFSLLSTSRGDGSGRGEADADTAN
ncbi:MAG: FHA domain-containing protein [Planctomycetota bacterium]